MVGFKMWVLGRKCLDARLTCAGLDGHARTHLLIFHSLIPLIFNSRDVNLHAHIPSHMRTFMPHVRVWIFSKLFLVNLYYLRSSSFKFHNDWSLSCGDICKTKLTFVQFFIHDQWDALTYTQLWFELWHVLQLGNKTTLDKKINGTVALLSRFQFVSHLVCPL